MSVTHKLVVDRIVRDQNSCFHSCYTYVEWFSVHSSRTHTGAHARIEFSRACVAQLCAPIKARPVRSETANLHCQGKVFFSHDYSVPEPTKSPAVGAVER